MIIRSIRPDEREQYNQLAVHPLQSWEWGEFRQAMGQTVERLGIFSDDGQLQEVWQVLFSTIPGGFTVGYVPRGPSPNEEIFPALSDIGHRHNALFIKLEPNIFASAEEEQPFPDLVQLLEKYNCREGQPLFTPYTFQLDLTKSEEDIFANCKSKTRYNIRVARRKGVEIVEDTSAQGLEDYLTLLEETTLRQKFFAHDQNYYRTMFEKFQETGNIRILKAMYEGKPITAWILFFFQDTAYYPYGASSRQHQEVMANNLMMWEALMLAKREGKVLFDMWGALGPNPDEKHKWFGFHRFKEGYGAELKQSLGSYDYILNFPMYSLFTLANKVRWIGLRLQAQFRR
jgi:lipid II:glycine glycyltransferase (peptidoglycan interpeptide bridge formation enzyme)